MISTTDPARPAIAAARAVRAWLSERCSRCRTKRCSSAMNALIRGRTSAAGEPEPTAAAISAARAWWAGTSVSRSSAAAVAGASLGLPSTPRT